MWMSRAGWIRGRRPGEGERGGVGAGRTPWGGDDEGAGRGDGGERERTCAEEVGGGVGG